MNEKKPTNPVKAIRAFCLGCVGNSSSEVKQCPSGNCPLHPFRFGKNPYRTKRELTEDQRTAMAARMKAVQAAKQEKRRG